MSEVPHVVDRAGWGSGPWDDEPDRLHWIDEATGLDCLIVRNRMGALCGYVGVPQGHPWYEKGYDHVDADVHGGLTYSDKCQGNICHSQDEAANEPVWWLGFDCAHSCDLCPSSNRLYRDVWDEKYRDVSYVRRHCTELARQASEAN